LRSGQSFYQRVDHDVADEVYPFGRYSLSSEVLICVARWREEQIREPVRDDSIYFFGHRPIATAEASFDVTHLTSELCGHQSSGDCGVHVTVDEDHVRANGGAHWLEALHDQAGLLPMGCRADFEVVVGIWDGEVFKEALRHLDVIVLARVHDDVLDIRPGYQLRMERSQFDEVGAGAHDGEHFQGWITF
jgi:hypothetical protein